MPIADSEYSVRALLSPLVPFIDRVDLSDICFSRPGRIYLETSLGWECVENDWFTVAWARALVIAAAVAEGRHVSDQYPFLAASLPHDLRLQAVLPPACRNDRILLCMRKASAEPFDFDSFNWTVEELPSKRKEKHPSQLKLLMGRTDFKRVVQGPYNIVVIGDTGAGKTAVLRSMIRKLPETDRLITIEDVHEIALRQPNCAQLMYGEDLGISASTCLRHALRLRPDRIILSECRGAEAFEFLQILLAGHRGAMTTYHAESSEHAIERLVLMARLHPAAAAIDTQTLYDIAHRCIDVVVHTKKLIKHMRICSVKFLH